MADMVSDSGDTDSAVADVETVDMMIKLVKWLLGAGAVLAFLLMLTHIASLFDGIAVREVVGVVGGFCAWLGFSYLHLTRRDTHD